MTDHALALQLQTQFRDLKGVVLPVGNGTKNGLSSVAIESCARLTTGECNGIVAYDPSEFLITALAGTPLHTLVSALEEHNQYLPFDPPLLEQNPTLGGTVAAGLSGPNRLLYGSLRDFVMEIQFIDGHGNLVRGGGKVVKNAAGFDLPKLVCGSYGRLGTLTEITLKVLPRPTGFRCLAATSSLENCIQAAEQLTSECLPISAIDFTPSHEGPAFQISVSLMGPQHALDSVSSKVSDMVKFGWQDCSPSDPLSAPTENGVLYRLATDVFSLPELHHSLNDADGLHPLAYTARGHEAWCLAETVDSQARLNDVLSEIGVSGVAIRGNIQSPHFVGDCSWVPLANRIKKAIDPEGRYPDY